MKTEITVTITVEWTSPASEETVQDAVSAALFDMANSRTKIAEAGFEDICVADVAFPSNPEHLVY